MHITLETPPPWPATEYPTQCTLPPGPTIFGMWFPLSSLTLTHIFAALEHPPLLCFFPSVLSFPLFKAWAADFHPWEPNSNAIHFMNRLLKVLLGRFSQGLLLSLSLFWCLYSYLFSQCLISAWGQIKAQKMGPNALMIGTFYGSLLFHPVDLKGPTLHPVWIHSLPRDEDFNQDMSEVLAFYCFLRTRGTTNFWTSQAPFTFNSGGIGWERIAIYFIQVLCP